MSLLFVIQLKCTVWSVFICAHTWVTHPGIKKIYIISDGRFSHFSPKSILIVTIPQPTVIWIFYPVCTSHRQNHAACILFSLESLAYHVIEDYPFCYRFFPFGDFSSILWYLYTSLNVYKGKPQNPCNYILEGRPL